MIFWRFSKSIDLGFSFVGPMFPKLFGCRARAGPRRGEPRGAALAAADTGWQEAPAKPFCPGRSSLPSQSLPAQPALCIPWAYPGPAWPPLPGPGPPKCTLSPPPHSYLGTLQPQRPLHSQGWVCSFAKGRARLPGGMQVCSQECRHIPRSLGPVLGAGLAGEQREHISPAV